MTFARAERAALALLFAALSGACQCTGEVVPPGCDGGDCPPRDGGCVGAQCTGNPGPCPDTVASAAPAGSTWTPTGPSGGRVTASLALPGAVLVGTGYARGFGLVSGRGASLFRSTDQGRTYVAVLRLPGATVSALAEVPASHRVYAAVSSLSGSSSDGVYVSDDLGLTFTPATQGLFAMARVRALAVAPGTPERVYALVLGTPMNPLSAASTLWRRDDGGDWTQLSATGVDPNPGGPALALAADVTDRDRVYLADGSRFYTSTDGGNGFTATAQGTAVFGQVSLANVVFLRADPASAAHLLLGTSDDGLLESGDQGVSWSRATNPSSVLDAAFGQGQLWVGTFDTGLLEGASSPALARTGECLMDPTVTAVSPLPDVDGGVVVGTTGGAYYSTDGAKTFLPAQGLDELVARVTASGDSLWLMSAVGLYRSNDSGDHWSRVGSGMGSTCIADVQVDPVDSDAVFVATDSDLFESQSPATSLVRLQLSDGGVSRPGPGLAPNIAAVRVDPAVPGRVWVYQRKGTLDPVGTTVPTGVFVSDDGARTFRATPLTSQPLALKSTFRFSPLALFGAAVFAGGIDTANQPTLWAGDGGAPDTLWADATYVPFGVHASPQGDVYLVGRNGPGVMKRTGSGFVAVDDGLDGGAQQQVYGLAFTSTGVLAATQAGVWLAPAGQGFTEVTGFGTTPVVWSVGVAPGGDVAVATTNQGVYRRQLP